jgi:hypothetical protein
VAEDDGRLLACSFTPSIDGPFKKASECHGNILLNVVQDVWTPERQDDIQQSADVLQDIVNQAVHDSVSHTLRTSRQPSC